MCKGILVDDAAYVGLEIEFSDPNLGRSSIGA